MKRARKTASTLCIAATVAATMALLGCGKKDKTGSDTQAPAAPKSVAGASVAKAVTSDAIKSLLAAVPGESFGVAFVDVRYRVWEMITGGMFVPLSDARKQKLDAELKTLLADAIGIDPSSAVAAVGFVFEAGGKPTGAVLIKSVNGALLGAQAAGDMSLKIVDRDRGIVAAMNKDILAIGPEAGVRAAFETIAGKRDNLAKANAAFATWLTQETKGAFVAASVWGPALKSPRLRAQAAQLGLERAVWSVSRTSLKVVAGGDKDKLTAAAKMATMGMNSLLAKVDELRQQTAGAPAMTRLGVTLQYHYAHSLAESLQPQPTADGLRLDVPVQISGGAALLPIVGVMSAVAIPAFMKYIKKSKTSEARMLAMKLYSGAADVHMRGKALPVSVGPTPPLGSCCQQGGKCAPNSQQWSHATWTALGFSVDDPHYYSYEWKSDGKRFVALAYGDLDCDGQYSTFAIPGHIDDHGQISANPSIRKQAELE